MMVDLSPRHIAIMFLQPEWRDLEVVPIYIFLHVAGTCTLQHTGSLGVLIMSYLGCRK